MHRANSCSFKSFVLVGFLVQWRRFGGCKSCALNTRFAGRNYARPIAGRASIAPRFGIGAAPIPAARRAVLNRGKALIKVQANG